MIMSFKWHKKTYRNKYEIEKPPVSLIPEAELLKNIRLIKSNYFALEASSFLKSCVRLFTFSFL